MSKSQPVTQSTTQSSDIPAWLSSASQQAATAGANLPQYSAYTGPGVAGLTPQQLQALGLASSTAGQGQGVAGSGVGAANALTGFNAGNVTAASLAPQIQGLLNPATQDVVNTTNAQIDKNTATAQNGADNNLAAQHAFGGSRQGVADAVVQNQGAMTKASTDASLNQADYSQALQTALSAGQGNQNAAIGSAGVQLGGVNALTGIGSALSGMNASDLNGLLTAGGVAQNTATNQNMFNYQQYMNGYQIPDQQASTFASILGSLPHNTNTTGTTTGTSYSNGLLGAAGLGLGVAGLGTGGGATLGGSALSGAAAALPLLLSDARMKRDIAPVGLLGDGTRIYRYRYRGPADDGAVHIGVMAQEVGHIPGAVVEKNGLKFVNYDRVADRAMRAA